MKTALKLLGVLLFFSVLGCKEYDDTELWKEVNNLANRVASLERLCNETNTNIGSLQKAIKALEDNDYITNVAPVNENLKVIGYTITFARSGSITIYNGRDGKNGDAPAIGVKKDSDGIYYWTVGNDWLTDDRNNKIKAEAKDGKDGTSPTFKIQDGSWHVSYDGGAKWEKLGKATGEDGKDGVSIAVEEDDQYVYLTFPSGTTLTLPKSPGAIGESVKVTTGDPSISDKYVIVTSKVENTTATDILVGIVYGETKSLSETKDNKVSKTASPGFFALTIKNLEKGKTYYYKAFVVINNKYYFGETKSFVFEEKALALGMKKDDVINALPKDGTTEEGGIVYYNDKEKKRTLSYQFKDGVLTEMALATSLDNITIEEIDGLTAGASFIGYLTPKVKVYANEGKKEIIKVEETLKNGYDYLLVGFTKY